MASRFTDTELWNEDWFCEMPGEYQLFVKYMFDTCDNAGVWKPKKFDFETKTKFKVSLDLLLKKMNGGGQQRILVLDNGRWFITGYILFQWFNKKKSFDLVLTNKLHKSLSDILLENKVDIKKVRGLKEVLKAYLVMLMETTQGVEERGMGKEEEGVSLSAEGFFSDKIPKDKVLTDIEIGATTEYLRITTKKMLTNAEIVEQWEAFKIKQFSVHEWYNGYERLLNHFRDSLKIQINNGNKRDTGSVGGATNPKPGTSTERVKTAKQW